MINLPASFSTVYAKTDVGHHEMKTRALRLKPTSRRLLVLVDGWRSGKELSLLLVGQDIEVAMGNLIDQGCIESVATDVTASTSVASSPIRAATASGNTPELDVLPAPQLRSPQQADMARHFMINTVNLMYGEHTRLSLIEAISDCDDTEALRAVYPLWLESMIGNRSAVKRLPELRSKLFAVL